jgi:membrane protein
LTAVGTALTSTLVSHLGLSDVPGVGVGTRIVGLLLATAADVLLFLFVLVRLPHTHVSLRVGLVGAVVAAVGFEILKVAGTYTIAASAHSATAGPFAGLIAVLVWVQLVARLVLFCTALTVVRSRVPQAFVPYEPVAGRSEPEGPSAVAVGAGLVGVGAVTGAAVTAYLLRRREGVTVR